MGRLRIECRAEPRLDRQRGIPCGARESRGAHVAIRARRSRAGSGRPTRRRRAAAAACWPCRSSDALRPACAGVAGGVDGQRLREADQRARVVVLGCERVRETRRAAADARRPAARWRATLRARDSSRRANRDGMPRRRARAMRRHHREREPAPRHRVPRRSSSARVRSPNACRRAQPRGVRRA